MYVESLAIMPESESLQEQPLEPRSLLNSDDTILPATLQDIPDIMVPLTLNTSMYLTLYFIILSWKRRLTNHLMMGLMMMIHHVSHLKVIQMQKVLVQCLILVSLII